MSPVWASSKLTPSCYTRHDLHSVRQRRHRSIVEIRRCHRHIAQARDTEHVQIGRIFRNLGAPLVDRIASKRPDLDGHPAE